MSNGSVTLDLQTGSAESNVAALGSWSESYIKRPNTIWGIPRFALVAGVVLAIATSPATAVTDFWFLEKRRRDVVTVTSARGDVIGRPISRAEALRIARSILERAERERIQLAEWEAQRGIQWGESA